MVDEKLVELQGEDLTQDISFNICKTANYPDFISYRTICACQSSDHDQTLTIEYDSELNMITQTIYYTAATKELGSHTDYFRSLWMSTDNWFVAKYALAGWWLTDLCNRLKYAFKIIFDGRIELENSYLFENKEHITSYLNAIHSAVDKITANSENNK